MPKTRGFRGSRSRASPCRKPGTVQRSVNSIILQEVQGATVYSDDAAAYNSLADAFEHESVNHSAGEYVREMAHTNGVESFWSVLKRAHKGVYHKFSVKHLHRYVNDFAGRHNVLDMNTIEQMGRVAEGMVGKRLTYEQLKADNGLPSGARS